MIEPNLHSILDKDGKAIAPVSTGTFLATLAFVPVWAFGVLPLSIAYQTGRVVLSPVLSKPERPTIDSGYVVKDSDIVPRPERKYDVVVLGATGFAGKLAARHLATTYGTDQKKVKWAIAGRTQAKLDKAKKELAEELGMDDIVTKIDVIIVDTNVPSTLPRLVRDTRALVTTVGPFSVYGNSVVEFCAKFGTHYCDITGETDFGKVMMEKWQETAKKTGAKIVPFCGHDCIPWDLTVMKLEEKIQSLDKDEHLVSVTCHDEALSSASGGTLATMMLGIEGNLALAPKEDPFMKNVSGSTKPYSTSKKLPFIFSRIKLPWNGKAAYATPFVMALVNSDIVAWSRSLLDKPALTYEEFSVVPDFKSAFVNWFGMIGLFSALLNPITGYMLREFVLPKPGEGPSMKKMQNDFFLSIYASGVGSKGTKVESIIYYPRCAGYLDTARMVAESALSMALEEEKLPVKGGGFFSSAVGLGDVLLERLIKTGTHFSIKKVE